MQKIVLLSLLGVVASAAAAPATYKKSGPDRYGVTTFWVKCENGNVSTTQCLKDVSHCGEGSNHSLMTAAVLACDGIMGLTMGPAK